MNRGEDGVVHQYRAGGFAVAARVDCEIWLVTLRGCRDLWPPDGALTGRRLRPTVHLERFASSSMELCAGLSEREACRHLAKLLQKRTQVLLSF